MRILVYGAGNIGSLYAAKLKDAGNDVSLLARGQRLCGIRDHGIVLEDFRTGQKTITRVRVVDRIEPEDPYELVLVALSRRSVVEVLPALAENHNTPNILFFGNNAAGPEEIIEALDRERVLLGFPGAAGVSCDQATRYLILDRREQPTTIGELNGSGSARIKAIADVLQSAGFPVSVSSNMDAWLRTHAAEIVPTAGALYMADCDIGQLKQNREALTVLVRAIREAHRVLIALGIPITPAIHRIFRWLPVSLMASAIRRKLDDDAWNIKIGHAVGARDEMMALASSFRKLVNQSGVATPALDQLSSYLSRADDHPDDTSADRTTPIRHAVRAGDKTG